jgi:glycosyltransferase involved in cell wall biosynthesis
MKSAARLERFHMAPLITALIDTYNHEKYIEQALVSVLEQGLSPAELEIIVVDDGSTDQTPAVIHKFIPRVRHLRKPNGGQASAFNAGFAESSGQMVALLDGDDWWAKGKLTAVANALEGNPDVGAVGHGHYRSVEGSNGEGELSAVAPAAQMLINLATPAAVRSWVYFLMGALTLRRKVFEWILPIPEDMIFMADSALQAAATVFGTLVLPEPLFYYRCHSENLYAFDPRHREKQRRRAEMAEIAYGGVYRRLVALGIPEPQAFGLVGHLWLDARRQRLHLSGGTRREALETEMRVFHATFKNPTLGYRLFKYLCVGAATLALPPRSFYSIRNWYASQNLGRLRSRLFR